MLRLGILIILLIGAANELRAQYYSGPPPARYGSPFGMAPPPPSGYMFRPQSPGGVYLREGFGPGDAEDAWLRWSRRQVR